MTKRRQFIYWLLDKYCEEGTILPLWAKTIIYILEPIESFKRIAYREIYNIESDVYTIHGVRYSGRLLRNLGFGEIGSSFQIVKREDGAITLKKLTSGAD